MTTALATFAAFVAVLIRRNVQPLFRPWFVAEGGAFFLGAVVGLPNESPYLDLYVTPKGEILTRFGNDEAEYGCLGTVEEIEAMGDQAPPAYRFGRRLANERRLKGARFVASAYRADYVGESDQEPPDAPTCNICDGLGHGYPGAGPCPLEERGQLETDRYGYPDAYN